MFDIGSWIAGIAVGFMVILMYKLIRNTYVHLKDDEQDKIFQKEWEARKFIIEQKMRLIVKLPCWKPLLRTMKHEDRGYGIASDWYKHKEVDGKDYYKLTSKGRWKIKEGALCEEEHNFLVYLSNRAYNLYKVVKGGKCRNCGHIYDRLPIEKEAHFDCPTKGCYWMIFSDGTQTHDYPCE